MVGTLEGVNHGVGQSGGDAGLPLHLAAQVHQRGIVVRQAGEAQVGGDQVEPRRMRIRAGPAGLEPEGGGGDLNRAGVEIDAVEVVLEDALDDGAVAPALLVRFAPMAGLLLVEREQEIEGHHQEMTRADGGVQELEVTHALGRMLDRVGRDGLGHVVGPAALGLIVERHQLRERHLAALALGAPVGAAVVQGTEQARLCFNHGTHGIHGLACRLG